MNHRLLIAVAFTLCCVVVHAQYASILAEQLNQYCENRNIPATGTHQVENKMGKSGPRGLVGPRGAPGEVNYTLVDEMISLRFKEMTKNNEETKKRSQKNCFDVEKDFAESWDGTGGIFVIHPRNISESMKVYCDVTTDDGGWIVFQRRVDGSENFFRNWADYENGFGDVTENFWFGLEKIHRLTSQRKHELRIDMEDWDGNTFYAKYTTFSIGDAASRYRLNVEGYSGTAGGDSLAYHNGQSFYTKDSDVNTCAVSFNGGWWYKDCHRSNLNGIYKSTGRYSGTQNGITWYHLKNSHNYSLKRVEMKLRPSF